MKKFRKRIFAAVLAALMIITAMPATALYASAETETVSDNAIGQAGTEDTEETVDGDTEETETDDAEATGDSDTEESAQETPAGSPEEDTAKCICETLCTEDSINGDCPVCGAEDADLSRCKGEKKEEQEKTGEKVITAWEWIDPEEYLTDGMLALPGAGRENPAFAEDVTALLPEKIQAKVAAVDVAEDGEETEEDTETLPQEEGMEIALTGWECASYPEDGAYEGTYTFTASLPEGFVLAEDTAALEVEVELGGAEMLSATVSSAYREASWTGSEVTCADENADSCTPVADSADAVTWDAGWYVVNSTVTISEPITVTGAVNLILADGCTLNAQKGIVVETDNSLTIYAQSGGTGTLNATGVFFFDESTYENNASAGIGGSGTAPDSGSITIHGGVINATGGGQSNYRGGAGIGGGSPNSGNGGNSGAVIIYGGTITANSGTGSTTGAGIGGGSSGQQNGGADSNITIYGGSVTAASTGTETGGAGIGGGGGFTGAGAGSNIQIYGGTVHATGSVKGAGIGGGGSGIISNDDVSKRKSGDGSITISGGSVTAVGGQNAAGIGGGGGYYSSYTWGGTTYSSGCTGGTGNVTISGGIVDASSPTDVGYSDYKGDPIGNGGNTTATATVSKTNAIVFENGVGTVYGTVTLVEPFTVPDGYSLTFAEGATVIGELNVPGAVAVAEKDGNIIGYYDANSLADAFAKSGNAGATFTLFDNVERNDILEIQIDCTLDLNGHNIHNTSVYGLSTKNGTTVTIRGQGRVISDQHRGLFVGGTVTLEGGTFIGAGFYSGVSVSDSGVLNVTGKDVVIEVSGGGCGLELNYAASAQLSAGTYKGVKAIRIANSDKTFADLLGTDGNYAYYGEDGNPIALSELEGQTELAGPVTVKECQHTGVEVTDLGGGKHGLDCPYCGYSYSHDSTTLSTLIATANQTANTVTLSEGCDIADCDYKLTVGTVSFAFPKAVYGQTDQAVTLTGIPADYIIICQAEGGDQIQNQDGDTEMSLTLKDLFGSTEITAGDHKLSVWFGGGTTGTFSNKCELTFTIAKADQTPLSITGAPGSVTYGDTFQLGISGGSGTGSVSWAASGATVDDVGNVIITRAGFVVITAMKEGDSNYTGIEGRITLNVNTASLTVTANDQTIAYGGHIEEGKEQVTVTGLCGSDTLTDITLTPSMENVPGGTGTIMPSAAKIQNGSGGDAAANYEITYKTGTLTIGKIQNAPGMPSAVMDNVSNSCQKISDVPLPDGWVWQDSDKNTALEVGVPVSAVAVYNGADSDYYENVTVTVTVTRIACDHTEGEILYTGDGESAPTCTKAGLGHTVCTKCGAVVRKDIAVSALGHDYDAGEVTKEPTAEAEGERTYTCKRCGHTYTETIPRKEPQGLWIGHMQPSVSYTGTAVKQEQIEVYYGTALLREKVDYTISYKDNTNAGTAQVIVTGKGNYTGKAVETFEIQPIDIGAQPGMTAIVATAVETGKNLKPAVTVTWNGRKLKEKTDYTLSYHTSIKTAGAYEVTVSGKGNYTGSMTKTFSVKPRGTKLLKSAAVSGIKKSYPYSGSGLASDLQSMVVKMGKTTLVKGTDYIVRTENTDVVGAGTVIIEAAQTDAYAGEKRIAVSITGTDLRKGSIKGVEKSYPYTGMPITPQITVYSGRSGKGEVILADKYTVSYTNNTEKGRATVTATGIPEKGYSGSVKVSYQIGRLNLAAEKAAGNLKVKMPADISHAKGGARPQPVITFTYGGVTRTLREGADYTLKYSNHTTATGSKPPTVKITGKGNYSGSITETFVISKQDIGRLSITVTDRAYGKNRKGSYYDSAPKVYDLDGKQLKSSRDYTVQYTYADSGKPIGKNDKIEPGTKLCAVVTAHEKSSYTGTLGATYVVREAKEVKDIGKVKNDKIENQQYTGSALTPEVRLYTQTGKIKTYLTDEDYEVIGCCNNTKRGTATILVRGKGVYSGMKRVTFRIVQKKIR